jgi:hypothetical protein
MQSKLLAVIALLAILLSLIPTGSAHAAVSITPTQGIVGTRINITGLTDGTTFKVKWDDATVDQKTAGSTGSFDFVVPDSYGGEHWVTVESPVGTQVLRTSFAVLPNIVTDPSSGPVGTTISVAGHGFGVAEKNVAVTYDGVNISTGITAKDDGSWSTTFNSPASASKQAHEIDASGDITKGTDITNKPFTVIPQVKVEPVAGGVGTLVTVTATGFASAEQGIKVTFDGKDVRSSITAESTGSWSTSFSVPGTPRGSRIIDVLGNTTTAADITDIVFTLAPAVNISPATGFVDESIKITGSGFANNETSITVILDDKEVLSNITGDSTGTWTANFKMPAAINGAHKITATGRMTPATDITPASFTVQPQIIAVPKGGSVKEEIRITGSGFSAGKDFNVSFEKSSVVSGVTNDTGSFAAIFAAPGGKSGACTITATDIRNITASTTFQMETTAPDVPHIAAPRDGATVGFMGNTRVSFDWSDVSDPSGVFYTLEVSDQSNFVNILSSHAKLTDSKYSLTEAEALPNGEYFWRVRATDGAGNSSDWTPVSMVKVGFMTTGTLIAIGVGIVVLLILIAVLPRLLKPKKRSSNWE